MRTSLNAPEIIVVHPKMNAKIIVSTALLKLVLDRTVRQLFIDFLQRLQRAFSCFKFNVGKDVFVPSASSQERRMLEIVTKYRMLERC